MQGCSLEDDDVKTNIHRIPNRKLPITATTATSAKPGTQPDSASDRTESYPRS